MKILKMFGNFEIQITDEEAEKIFKINSQDLNALIKLSSGDIIRVNSIQAIINPPPVPYWGGYKCWRNGNGRYKYMRENGDEFFLSDDQEEEMKFIEQEKLKKIEIE